MKKILMLLLIVVLIVGCQGQAPVENTSADEPVQPVAQDPDMEPQYTGVIKLNILPRDIEE